VVADICVIEEGRVLYSYVPQDLFQECVGVGLHQIVEKIKELVWVQNGKPVLQPFFVFAYARLKLDLEVFLVPLFGVAVFLVFLPTSLESAKTTRPSLLDRIADDVDDFDVGQRLFDSLDSSRFE